MVAASKVRAQRTSQLRRAGLLATLVSLYFRDKVAVEDPAAVERWLDLMVPKIIAQGDLLAREAAAYADAVRRDEGGRGAIDIPFKFEPIQAINEEQVRASLMAVGVKSYSKKAKQIRELDDKQFEPESKAALIAQANRVAAGRVAGSTLRLVQESPRRTLEEGAKNDPIAFGYVRVTKNDPCFFCAMLASRGLEGGIYSRDSFDASDPRFTGDGNAKVHDSCGCSLKPVYSRADTILEANQRFTDAWYEFSGAGDADALTNFRRNWEGREAYLKKAS